MSAVYFQLTKDQDQEMKSLMKKEGYSNKAEFFRFLMKFYKYYHDFQEELRFRKVTNDWKNTLIRLDKKGKLFNRSLEEQLADL